jgi:hypothetical protein
MAVQQSTPTLSFRGTPILIEGLVPFEYRHILGGAAVRVSLAGRDKKGGPEPLNVQTLPSGPATLVRFSVSENTPAGSYTGELQAGESRFPMVVEIEGRRQLQVTPSRFSLVASPGTQVTVDIAAVNGGNVPVEIAEAGGFGLFDVQGADRAIGEALRSDEAASLKGERRVDRLIEHFANEHGGLVRVQFREGAGLLAPGEFRALKVLLRMPDGIKPGRAYSGTWPVGNLRLSVYVDVPGYVESKEVQ